ncbi:MAG: four-helix bundle copper-binding protein [Geobacteraceae bacterium GWC2_58_44]|nr:MAG: four-helix bundle copper-binding protein [Geobacteraceae bacterium GWC2_58_44]
MKTEEMLGSHPRKLITELSVISGGINACVECADACNSCADACLGEEKVQMLTKCIRLNLDCADICQTTARILVRQTETVPQLVRAQLESCVIACRVCAQECESHAEMHQHCRICRTACQTCEKICQELISRLPAGAGV